MSRSSQIPVHIRTDRRSSEYHHGQVAEWRHALSTNTSVAAIRAETSPDLPQNYSGTFTSVKGYPTRDVCQYGVRPVIIFDLQWSDTICPRTLAGRSRASGKLPEIVRSLRPMLTCVIDQKRRTYTKCTHVHCSVVPKVSLPTQNGVWSFAVVDRGPGTFLGRSEVVFTWAQKWKAEQFDFDGGALNRFDSPQRYP